VDSAIIKGGAVAHDTALSERSWDELGPGFDAVIALLDSLNEFGGVAIADAQASINLQGSTDIEASTAMLPRHGAGGGEGAQRRGRDRGCLRRASPPPRLLSQTA
jgi:hypothetical protein